ncbi:hypothetical protein DWU98_03615 [Dyella monticola]|uniref:Uncharacterized protein n=1 Tax=Dyella monticola TaxID=1927958 RepID=A0A370X9J3_9GAMM|nr:hypothetical protein DWU98_03615 [Dyella monticola]
MKPGSFKGRIDAVGTGVVVASKQRTPAARRERTLLHALRSSLQPWAREDDGCQCLAIGMQVSRGSMIKARGLR